MVGRKYSNPKAQEGREGETETIKKSYPERGSRRKREKKDGIDAKEQNEEARKK